MNRALEFNSLLLQNRNGPPFASLVAADVIAITSDVITIVRSNNILTLAGGLGPSLEPPLLLLVVAEDEAAAPEVALDRRRGTGAQTLLAFVASKGKKNVSHVFGFWPFRRDPPISSPNFDLLQLSYSL